MDAAQNWEDDTSQTNATIEVCPDVPQRRKVETALIVARLFGYTRLLESQIADLKTDLARVRTERDEWAGKVLVRAGLTPLFHESPPAEPPKPLPPIGPTAKRAYLAAQPKLSEPTNEEIVEAARRAHVADRNGG